MVSKGMLTSSSGSSKVTVILLLLVAAGYWYWNQHSTHTGSERVQAPAPASPQAAPPKQEQVDLTAADYARKAVVLAGVDEGKLDKPGLILRFENRGDRDLSNVTVKIIGYREPFVMDTSKAQGTEYTVDLEVKSFPARKITESVLYFPPGVLSIDRNITVCDAQY